ncbi:unnamed protein product [Closterium sp. Yama58-4]|nr:unnamed protein product [Closterium sp. Yama58-4]
MELPTLPLPFLDLHCSPECAADCDGVHIPWKVQEIAGATGWEPVGTSSSKCAALSMGAQAADEQIVTSSCTDHSLLPLPVISSGTNSMAMESVLGDSFKVEGWPDFMPSISESQQLHVRALTHVSISHGCGGHVSMLTQPSLPGQGFTQMTTTAASPSRVSTHDEIHSVVMNSAAASLPNREPPQHSMAAPPAAVYNQIHSMLNTHAAATTAAAAVAALPDAVPIAAWQLQSLEQGASLSLRSAHAQATPAQRLEGSTQGGPQPLIRDGTPAIRDGTLYDMIVSGRFKRKGSSSWWDDDSIAETPANMQPRKTQCLVGGDGGLGLKGPHSGTPNAGSLAFGSQCDIIGLDPPRTRVEFPAPIPAVGSTAAIVGSVAVSRPPAAATERAASLDPLSTRSALGATQGADLPAQSAHTSLRDQAGGNGLGLDRPPIHRRHAVEKLRRHRISAGFKRLEKILPPTWMRQKHQLNMSSRTDMASLLDAAVDSIRELEDRKAQLAQAYIQQVSESQQ